MQFLSEVGEILAEYDRVAMATRAAMVAQVQRAAVRVSEAVDADAKRQAMAFEERVAQLNAESVRLARTQREEREREHALHRRIAELEQQVAVLEAQRDARVSP